jgi:hypothetical protein
MSLSIGSVAPIKTEKETEVLRDGSLKLALVEWNDGPGRIWGLKAVWNDDAWNNFQGLEKELFDGAFISDQPGPFKRLGAFCVLVQYFPFFDLQKHDGSPLDDPARSEVLWLPRIAVWSLSHEASVLRLNDSPLPFTPGFPSAHMLVDFIGYLRNLKNSAIKNPDSILKKDLLAERAITVGIILEGATYASISPSDLLLKFTHNSAKCRTAFNGEQKADLDTQDPDYA